MPRVWRAAVLLALAAGCTQAPEPEPARSAGAAAAPPPMRAARAGASEQPPPAAFGAEGGCPELGLPVVAVAGNSARQLRAAFDACVARRGCRLRLAPGPTDARVMIAPPGHCYREIEVCVSGDLSRGLVIEGRGATLRPPLERGPYKDRDVLAIQARADIPALQLRGFAIDGRKQELPAPAGDPHGWSQRGIYLWQGFRDTPGPLNRNVCLKDLAIRNTHGRGVELERIDGLTIDGLLIEDIGCWERVSPCPRVPRATRLGNTLGVQAAGSGLDVNDFVRNFAIRDVTVRRSTKNGVVLKSWPGKYGGGPTIGPGLLENLQVGPTGQIGLQLHGTRGVTVSGVRIERTQSGPHSDGVTATYDTFGVKLEGPLEATRLRGVRVIDPSGLGIEIAGQGDVSLEAVVEGACRERREGYPYAAVVVSPKTAGDWDLDLRVERNGCREEMSVHPAARASLRQRR